MARKRPARTDRLGEPRRRHEAKQNAREFKSATANAERSADDDREDLAAFVERVGEPSLGFGDVLKELRLGRRCRPQR